MEYGIVYFKTKLLKNSMLYQYDLINSSFFFIQFAHIHFRNFC